MPFVVWMRGARSAAREEGTMSDYVLLYAGGSTPEDPAEQKRVMDLWTAWFDELGSAVKDRGNPFTGQAKTITADGAVSDGSGGGNATGYSIIRAGSLDEATASAKGCPLFESGGTLMVFETLDIM
jgi:hypothetical protein